MVGQASTTLPFTIEDPLQSSQETVEFFDSGASGTPHIVASFGNPPSTPINLFVVNNYTTEAWSFMELQGFGFSTNGGTSWIPVMDLYQNLYCQTISLGQQPQSTIPFGSPGTPPSDTLANLAAWCNSLYEAMASCNLLE
jgi:hypothetical protein